MRFLDNLPKFVFFTGKGGVGKTSLSCATAVRLAGEGRKVLLVSTDPASNVAQVFDQPIGSNITPVEDFPGISALELDPQASANAYRERIVGPVRGVMPESEIRALEEQLSGACTTEIAAFDEFTALLTNPDLVNGYDHIIFDTAPTGHTIRLLQLPGAWSGFISDNPNGASCLGPLSGLEKQRAQYASAVDALASSERTRLILVTRPQRSALDEVERTRGELAAIGITGQFLIVNGVMPAAEAERDTLAAAIRSREQSSLANMPGPLRSMPVDTVPLKPFNIIGRDALARFFDEDAVGAVDDSSAQPTAAGPPSIADLVDEIAASGRGLIMMMGKGGVGKTTMAAAVAVELASRGFATHLTTTDPASHLAAALAGSVPNLEVSSIDPRTEIEAYTRHVMATKGKGLDDAGRAALEEDLRSPCTEEIAVFQGFSRAIREAGRKFVVMDTAPTGHTLMLLDTTGAYHHEITRHTAKGISYTTPLMRLQDPAYTKVIIVALAETTPVLEAAGLQEELRRAGIEPWAWIINNSLAASPTRSDLLRRRAAEELKQIDIVRRDHAGRFALVPIQTDEPVGTERLHKMASARLDDAFATM